MGPYHKSQGPAIGQGLATTWNQGLAGLTLIDKTQGLATGQGLATTWNQGLAGLTLIDKVPVPVLAQERVDPAPDLAQERVHPPLALALGLASNLQYRNRQERREREQL